MPDQDAFEAAPSDLRIGDHTLLSLACSIALGQFQGDRLDHLNQILWTIRYAYICGMQRGAADANDAIEELLKRLPAEPDLPDVEHGIEASNGFRGAAR
jgi:hypothetical protein